MYYIAAGHYHDDANYDKMGDFQNYEDQTCSYDRTENLWSCKRKGMFSVLLLRQIKIYYSNKPSLQIHNWYVSEQ